MNPTQPEVILPLADARTERLLDHARRATGFMPDDEGAALHAAACLAAGEGPEPLLEVGAYCGKSTLYLAAAVWRAAAGGSGTAGRPTAPGLPGPPTRPGRAGGPGRPSLVYSLDHHRGSEENQEGWEHHDPTLVDPSSGRMETLGRWRAALAAAGADDLVAGLVGESAGIARSWATPLRFVFIDGGHGPEPAWADYHGWAPKVVGGGVLAIHDVFPDPADGGRPPFEIYSRALESGAFVEDTAAGRGSLRVLHRVAGGPEV